MTEFILGFISFPVTILCACLARVFLDWVSSLNGKYMGFGFQTVSFPMKGSNIVVDIKGFTLKAFSVGLITTRNEKAK